MAYDNIITRPDAQALVPEEVSRAMLGAETQDSAVLRMFDRIPVARNQTRFPIISALPVAYWVTGDTGLKQTTEMAWANKFMNIEEMAAIMAIPDAVVADAEVNLWAGAEPYLREAFGRLLDETVFFGVSAPASFPTNVLAAAVAAANTTTEALAATAGGFFGDFDLALSKLEDDGFDPTGVIAARSAKGKFRSARNSQGDRLDGDRVTGQLNEIDGLPIAYPMRGQWPAGLGAGSNVRLFIGDWTQFKLGVRQDITMDIFREGVIQDNTGAIVFNLMQQDLTAVRLTFRVGWQVANLINHDQPTEGSRYPVSVLKY